MLLRTFMSFPVPIFAAVIREAAPQAIGPDWLVGASAAAFTLLWFLNAIGKLPGGGGERREASFKDEDRSRLADIHAVVTREDSDKPGWRMVWHSARETREMRDLLVELSDLREDWATERQECKDDRVRLVAEHEQERQRWHERLSRLEEANIRYEAALQHGAGGVA
jgi:hypothetical protein